MAQVTITRNPNTDKSDRLISGALKAVLKEVIEVTAENDSVVQITRAEDLARNIIETARYDENANVRAIFSKLILEYTEGKPAVQSDKETQALPAFNITLSIPEKQELDANARMPLPALAPSVVDEVFSQ